MKTLAPQSQPQVLTPAQAKQVAGGTGVNRIGCFRINGTWKSTGGSWLSGGYCQMK